MNSSDSEEDMPVKRKHTIDNIFFARNSENRNDYSESKYNTKTLRDALQNINDKLTDSANRLLIINKNGH